MKNIVMVVILMRASLFEIAWANEAQSRPPRPNLSEIFAERDMDNSGGLSLAEFLAEPPKRGAPPAHENADHPRPEPDAAHKARREAELKAAFIQAVGESGELNVSQFQTLLQNLRPKRPR